MSYTPITWKQRLILVGFMIFVINLTLQIASYQSSGAVSVRGFLISIGAVIACEIVSEFVVWLTFRNEVTA